MQKYKVDYSKIKLKGGSLSSLCGGFDNDTIFYGEKEGEYVNVDLSKPITKNGNDVNIANIIGIGAKNVSLKIKREYVRFVPNKTQIALGSIALLGILGYSVFQIVKLNKLGY